MANDTVSRKQFDETVDELVKAGLTKTYIARTCRFSRSVFKKTSDKISIKSVEALLEHLPQLRNTAALPKEDRDKLVFGQTRLLCPVCKTWFGKDGPHTKGEFCSLHCRTRYIQSMQASGEIDPDHNPVHGLPSTSAYSRGCRCAMCKQAVNTSKHNRKDKCSRMHPDKARKLIKIMASNGATYADITRLAHLSRNTVNDIMTEKVSFISNDTYRALQRARLHQQIEKRETAKQKRLLLLIRDKLAQRISTWNDAGISLDYIAKTCQVSYGQIIKAKQGETVQIDIAKCILTHAPELDELASNDAVEVQMEMNLYKKALTGTCRTCGATFAYKDGPQRYCSSKCRDKAQRKAKRDKQNERIDAREAGLLLDYWRSHGGSIIKLCKKTGLTKTTLMALAAGRQPSLRRPSWDKLIDSLIEIEQAMRPKWKGAQHFDLPSGTRPYADTLASRIGHGDVAAARDILTWWQMKKRTYAPLVQDSNLPRIVFIHISKGKTPSPDIEWEHPLELVLGRVEVEMRGGPAYPFSERT